MGRRVLSGVAFWNIIVGMSGPTVVDLFCGAGGMSHGFAQAGFHVVAGVDHDKDALATFAANHPGSRALPADLAEGSPDELADSLAIAPGTLDCLVGGPPCQGFSRNRAFNHVDGVFVDDPRNHLYWHFFEYVARFRPKVVVMENVPEILIRANGAFREAVAERFASLGYHAEPRVLNAAEFGVPQWRRRAFFVAGRDNQTIRFPEPTSRPGLRAGRRTPESADYVGGATAKNYTLSLFGELPTGPTVWDGLFRAERADPETYGRGRVGVEARSNVSEAAVRGPANFSLSLQYIAAAELSSPIFNRPSEKSEGVDGKVANSPDKWVTRRGRVLRWTAVPSHRHVRRPLHV